MNDSPSSSREACAQPIAASARSQRIPPCTVPERARVLRAGLELERRTPCVDGDHPHADQLRRPAAAEPRPRSSAGTPRVRHGVSTVRITSPSRIASKRLAPVVERRGARDHAREVERARRAPTARGAGSLPRQMVAAVRDEDARALVEQLRQVELGPLAGRREPDQHDRAARAIRPSASSNVARRPTTSNAKSTGPALDVGRAERARLLELALVEVDRADLRGAGDARALDRPRGRRRRSRSPRRARRARPAPSRARTSRRSRRRSRSGTPARPAARAARSRRRPRGRPCASRTCRCGGPASGRAVGAMQPPGRAGRPRQWRGIAAQARCAHPHAVFQPMHDAVAGRDGRRRRRRRPRRCPRPRARAAPEARGPSRPPRSRAGRCGRRRSPRCGRAPRPAPARRRRSPRARRRPARTRTTPRSARLRSSSRTECRARRERA